MDLSVRYEACEYDAEAIDSIKAKVRICSAAHSDCMLTALSLCISSSPLSVHSTVIPLMFTNQLFNAIM